jgi:hypothetical protein
MPELNEMDERQLRDEINRLAGEYTGLHGEVSGLAGKPLVWLHARATAFTMMVRLRQRGEELGKSFSADENLAYALAGEPPDNLLRSQALYASAIDIWESGIIPVESEAFDRLLDELIARTFTDYRGHRISYRIGQYFVDSLAGHVQSQIVAMRQIGDIEGE